MLNFSGMAEQLEKVAGNGEITWQQKVDQSTSALHRFGRADLSMILLAKVGFMVTTEMPVEEWMGQINQWLETQAKDFREMAARYQAMFEFSIEPDAQG